ncbi:BTAD domain-containing putative transcriptional regulator [Pseudonocardia ailaonensis]|uniref:BTAD domain-containing putative transcriptional regulator n=1 Tax=Pseudonocardia ailaonensis TaxID=367279 RepID=A0ABN2MX64_9PSEU
MRIGVLGPVAAWDATGADVAPTGLRLRGLLARLALSPGRTVPADTLVDDLWGDEPPDGAGNALQSLVSRLRRALGPELVATVPGGYRLQVAPDDVDAVCAERRLAEARAADPTTARRLVGEALALWRGPALSDVRRLPFADAAAARLTDQRSGAIVRAAELDLAAGRTGPIGPLTALLDEQPLNENAAAALARSLHAAGRQADALAVLDRTRDRLVDELGVDPGEELQTARLDVLRTAPARPARAGAPHSLTSFVGRDADVTRLRQAVDDARLVTLVGPGGAGKTRLAREAVGEVRYPVVVAELAPLTGAEQLADTVLAAVGTPELLIRTEDRVQDGTERLAGAIGRRELLVVLDNCEHLIDAAATLAATLLDRCPHLRVIATSREPLSVPGERLHPVQALDDVAAVRLFTDRAVAVDPTFTSDDEVLREICRRLDGQPLPIELAAARLRTLSPEEILARLDDRFRLLTTGARTVLPRHQTLRAVVDWSWDLLDEGERAIARRLATFSGGATLAAAEEVCGAGDLDVFELLTGLVDKSLVVAVPQPDGAPTRYRMLETIREYATERLAESGERAATVAAHAAWVVALVEEAEPKLRTVDQLRAVGVLRAEAGNITGALRRAITEEDVDTAYRVAAGMFWSWLIRGAVDESVTWIREVARLEGPAPRDPLARVTAFRALEAVGRGSVEDAIRHVAAALELAETLPRPRHPILELIGPVSEAFTVENDGPMVDVSEHHPDPWVRAFALQVRSAIAENLGEIEAQRSHLRRAHALFSTLGDRFGLGVALNSLGELEALGGNSEAAITAYEEAIALATELANDDDLPQFMIQRGGLAMRLGDLALARKLLTEALGMVREGTFESVEMVHVSLAELERREGDLDAARRRLSRVDPVRGGGMAIPQRKAFCLVQQAQVELDAGDPAAASKYLMDAVRFAGESRDGPVIGAVAEVAARYLLLTGDVPGAARALAVAEDRRGTLDLGNPDVVSTVETVGALPARPDRDRRAAELDWLLDAVTHGAAPVG